MSVLNELSRIRSVMGILKEENGVEGPSMNTNLKKFVENFQTSAARPKKKIQKFKIEI